jgi:FixJ family two-component response regulator
MAISNLTPVVGLWAKGRALPDFQSTAKCSLKRTLSSVLRKYEGRRRLLASDEEASHLPTHLMSREYEIMPLVISSMPSKTIATDLHVSQHTEEMHRAAVMKKTGLNCLAARGRIGFAVNLYEIGETAC